jgi:hypothetical protein
MKKMTNDLLGLPLFYPMKRTHGHRSFIRERQLFIFSTSVVPADPSYRALEATEIGIERMKDCYC